VSAPRPIGLDLDQVRHPLEKLVFWGSVLTNAVIIAAAILVIELGPKFLEAHTRLNALLGRVQVAAIGLVLLLPVFGLIRRARWAGVRENAVRLSWDQIPLIFGLLEGHCRALGIPSPELYVSMDESLGLSSAMDLPADQRLIVLGPNLFAGMNRMEDRLDVFDFFLAHELGRLVLGHAGWREDVLLGYLKWIPVLRFPLVAVQAASRDRFAATISPGWRRGLIFTAAGGDLIDTVDPAELVRQVLYDATPQHWALLAKMGRGSPVFADRVRALYHGGFIAHERGEAEKRAPHPPAPPGVH
jgi:hypothetical protein